MPKFAQLVDLKEYDKKKTTIRDDKVYLEFCKMFTNYIVPRRECREWAYKTNFADFVTASDKAYMIWEYVNYSEWWLKKHRHDKHVDLLISRKDNNDSDA